MKKKLHKILSNNNLLFVTIIFIVIFIGFSTIVRGEKEISYAENRKLGQFPHLTVHGYLSGDFQKYFSNAFSDQFIGAETIKRETHDVLTFVNYSKIPKYICSNKYVNVSDMMNTFNCGDSIIYGPSDLDPDRENTILSRLETYSHLNDYIDTYYYLIETSTIYNFEENRLSIDISSILKDNLKGNYSVETLKINNYDDYKTSFYKNDHHWNYLGSYQAYTDMVKMMTNDEPLKPIETITFDDIYFFGSSARSTQIFDYKENFTVYRFNYPEYTVKINKDDAQYGKEEEYFKGLYDNGRLVNHYGEFYGGDYGEVVFNFNDDTKPNLLILGSSHTNAVNKLIASHFNNTYVVDLRHYDWAIGESFDIKTYIDNNDIDKVLIIADFNFLQDHDFDMKWSE